MASSSGPTVQLTIPITKEFIPLVRFGAISEHFKQNALKIFEGTDVPTERLVSYFDCATNVIVIEMPEYYSRRLTILQENLQWLQSEQDNECLKEFVRNASHAILLHYSLETLRREIPLLSFTNQKVSEQRIQYDLFSRNPHNAVPSIHAFLKKSKKNHPTTLAEVPFFRVFVILVQWVFETIGCVDMEWLLFLTSIEFDRWLLAKRSTSTIEVQTAIASRWIQIVTSSIYRHRTTTVLPTLWKRISEQRGSTDRLTAYINAMDFSNAIRVWSEWNILMQSDRRLAERNVLWLLGDWIVLHQNELPLESQPLLEAFVMLRNVMQPLWSGAKEIKDAPTWITRHVQQLMLMCMVWNVSLCQLPDLQVQPPWRTLFRRYFHSMQKCLHDYHLASPSIDYDDVVAHIARLGKLRFQPFGQPSFDHTMAMFERDRSMELTFPAE